ASIARRISLLDARIRANRTTLWKRAGARLARTWGRTQSDHCPASSARRPTIHPRGQFQSPACESRERMMATRTSAEWTIEPRLLAISESLPKPRFPAPNHIINLGFKIYIKGERGVASKPANDAR